MSPNKKRPQGKIPAFLVPRLGRLTPSRFEYGRPLRIGLTGRQWLLTDPDDNFHVLVRNASNYTKSRELTSREAKNRVGGGLLGRQGVPHHDRRRTVQSLFTARAAETYTGQIEQQCHWLTAQWQQGQIRDLAIDMGRLTRKVLVTALFGDVDDKQFEALEQAISHRRKHTERVYFSKRPRYDRWPTKSRRRDREAQQTVADFVTRGLRDLRDGKPSGKLLEGMSRLALTDGRPMADSDIKDEVLSLMSTGHETITEWLVWCWVLIGMNPGFEAHWRAEVDQLGPPSSVMSLEAIEAPLTNGLLDESLRLYPPTWLFARVPLKDDQLASGAKVKAGQNLLLCPYLMHRHPVVFPEPEKFDPMRFQSLRTEETLGRTYFPFGAGAHRCTGDKLARMETLVVLLTLARRFSFEPIRRDRIIPTPGITLSVQDGWPVRVHGNPRS